MRQEYKFYCPICLRYFNHMLVSSCCNNYICRLCIGWQANKAKADPEYSIYCSHCYEEEFRLRDVDSDAESIKYYTDTPNKCKQRSEMKQAVVGKEGEVEESEGVTSRRGHVRGVEINSTVERFQMSEKLGVS